MPYRYTFKEIMANKEKWRTVPTGRPAIIPNLNIDPNSVMPVFDENAVHEFLESHVIYGEVERSARIIESIEFLTTQEANEKASINIGVAKDKLVCLVKIRNRFVLHHGFNATDAGYNFVYIVFDAETGNLYGLEAFRN